MTVIRAGTTGHPLSNRVIRNVLRSDLTAGQALYDAHGFDLAE